MTNFPPRYWASFWAFRCVHDDVEGCYWKQLLSPCIIPIQQVRYLLLHYRLTYPAVLPHTLFRIGNSNIVLTSGSRSFPLHNRATSDQRWRCRRSELQRKIRFTGTALKFPTRIKKTVAEPKFCWYSDSHSLRILYLTRYLIERFVRPCALAGGKAESSSGPGVRRSLYSTSCRIIKNSVIIEINCRWLVSWRTSPTILFFLSLSLPSDPRRSTFNVLNVFKLIFSNVVVFGLL